MNRLEKAITLIGYIFISLLLMGLNYLIVCGVLYLACWGLGWTFTYKLALGVWALTTIIQMCFPKGGNR